MSSPPAESEDAGISLSHMKNNLQILFEDNHLIVVVKPFNILTQDDKTGDNSIYIQVKTYLKDKYHKPGNVYLGLIHRLDRPVKGIIVFAKTSKAASRLSEQLRVGDFTKKYLALSYGQSLSVVHKRPLRSPSSQWQTLTHYLQKNPKTNTSQVSDTPKPDYKKSILKYRFIDQTLVVHLQKMFNLPTKFNLIKTSVIEIKLITGRSHQIRAQLSHINLPILGDIKYGSDIILPNKNIALVANQLSFYHPITKEKLDFFI
jgi:23S rRNA pseudouridine1911/1915/1917 synthase